MIKNDDELAVEREQLARIERALDSLRADVKNARNFEIFSEGYIEQINLLKAQIENYLAHRNSFAPDKTAQQTPEQQPTNVP